MEYQVGQLTFIKEGDPIFPDEADAVCRAIDDSKTGQPYGVWTGQSFGSELVAIIH